MSISGVGSGQEVVPPQGLSTSVPTSASSGSGSADTVDLKSSKEHPNLITDKSGTNHASHAGSKEAEDELAQMQDAIKKGDAQANGAGEKKDESALEKFANFDISGASTLFA